MKNNLIGGEWTPGARAQRNINPYIAIGSAEGARLVAGGAARAQSSAGAPGF